MTPEQIYLEAAKRVHSGKEEFSCMAVRNVSVDAGFPFFKGCTTEYDKLFSPGNCRLLAWAIHWLEEEGDDSLPADWKSTLRDLRVLALLFMAAISREED